MTAQQDTILTVPWIVAQPIDNPAQPAAPNHEPDVIASRSGEAISPVRPWAKPLLTGVLALAALWLAGLAVIILDGALFAEATIRSGYGLAGIPICCLIAIALIADPDHEDNADELYFTLGRVPSAQCTPSRNTITGRPS